MLADLIRENRSCRRFNQRKTVNQDTLVELVDLARLSASGANIQPLKYILSCEEKTNADIFSCLAWAGYLKDWAGPIDGERPSAYIVMLGDTQIAGDVGYDPGIAGLAMLLGAREKGLGGCMLGAVKRDKLAELLGIAAQHTIVLVLAIGHPREIVAIEPVGTDGSIKYWRDKEDIHHVPKRSLEDIILHSYTP